MKYIMYICEICGAERTQNRIKRNNKKKFRKFIMLMLFCIQQRFDGVRWGTSNRNRTAKKNKNHFIQSGLEYLYAVKILLNCY